MNLAGSSYKSGCADINYLTADVQIITALLAGEESRLFWLEVSTGFRSLYCNLFVLTGPKWGNGHSCSNL